MTSNRLPGGLPNLKKLFAKKKTADKKAAAAKKANAPTPTPTIAKARAQTTTYLDTIAKQQKKQATEFTSKLSQQSSAYEKQLKGQSATLNSQISQLTKQSASQVQNYQTMLTRITSQQQTELEKMRLSFANQNEQSEGVISNLQSEIDRLSRPLKPPVIDVDTSPAVVGIGQATQQSQMRQRLGTRGGLQKRQQTGSLGLAVGA
jgi:seryl-tRNA synthetase